MRLKTYSCLLLLLLFFSCREQQQKTEEPPNLVSGEEKQFTAFVDSLKHANASDYQIVNEIRKYLALKVDRGASRDSLFDVYFKIPWEQLSEFHCVELFEQNKLTAKCGLTSYILAKLYDHAGYTCYIYDCGFDTLGLSHEFNLVQLDGKLIVQDAFLDMTINNADGSPHDFIQLLSEVRKRDFSNIRVIQDSIASEVWIDSLKEVLTLYCANEEFRTYLHNISISDNRIKGVLNVNYDFLAARMLQNMRPLLKSEGFGENFLSIYLKPRFFKNGNTGERADSLMSTVKSVINTGSPN